LSATRARAFWLIFLPAAAYQGLAIFAALRHRAKQRASRRSFHYRLPVSVLKPVRGTESGTYAAFVSQVQQDYPEYEVLFGASEDTDPAVNEVRRLKEEFPDANVRLIVGSRPASNRKVGVLMQLAGQARHEVWVVNDGDIKVGRDYLSEVTAPLADRSVGVVTCPYRVRARGWADAWEGFGIATDFIPSTLVASLIGVRDFGLGSTLAFRAADLERAGGFAGISEYLADDYHLAKKISRLGKRVVLSTYVVETSLGDPSWTGSWLHQLRWARTIRRSKGAGFAGLPITQAGVWITVALATGAFVPAAILAGLRVASALVSGSVLGSASTAALALLAPAWDLYAFAVWIVAYMGQEVRWRHLILKIDSEGRISQLFEVGERNA